MAPSRRTWFDERGLIIAAASGPSDAANRAAAATATNADEHGAAASIAAASSVPTAHSIDEHGAAASIASGAATAAAASIASGAATAAAASIASGAAAAATRHLELALGAYHYWRAEPRHWKPCLAAMKRLGLTTVETHVPWRVHEPTEGRFTWTGARDLRRFIELAGEAGLAVLLRLGPAANAELPGFGFPDDVLADPAHAARTAHGSVAWLPAPPRTIPVLSLAAPALHARVHAWVRAVADQVAPLAAPAGPLVALAIEFEPSLFRHGAYDLDYHPEAIARWVAAHPQWPEPPRAWAEGDAARCLAWVCFKRDLAADAVRRVCDALDDTALAGLARVFPAPLAHASPVGAGGATTATGLHPGLPTARDLAAAFATDARRADAPSSNSDSSNRRDPSGNSDSSNRRDPSGNSSTLGGPLVVTSHGPASAASIRRAALRTLGELTPLPIALESGCGEAAWMPPTGGADADRRRALSLLAAGARGIGFSMAVERENWTGGLLEPDGTPATDATWVPRLLAALRDADWTSLRRRPTIAVVPSATEADHASAAALLEPVAPIAAALLGVPPEPLAIHAPAATTATAPATASPATPSTAPATTPSLARHWQHAVEQALERAGVAYEFLDERATADELASYRAVIAPLCARVSRRLYRTLRDVAADKRAIVVLGPEPPTLDERGQPLDEPPLRRTGKMRPGSLEDLEGLAADLAQLSSEPALWRCPSDHAVLSLFLDTSGRSRLLFLHNDGPTATLELSTSEPRVHALRDPLSEQTFALSPTARIPVAAGDVRLLVIERP